MKLNFLLAGISLVSLSAWASPEPTEYIAAVRVIDQMSSTLTEGSIREIPAPGSEAQGRVQSDRAVGAAELEALALPVRNLPVVNRVELSDGSPALAWEALLPDGSGPVVYLYTSSARFVIPTGEAGVREEHSVPVRECRRDQKGVYRMVVGREASVVRMTWRCVVATAHSAPQFITVVKEWFDGTQAVRVFATPEDDSCDVPYSVISGEQIQGGYGRIDFALTSWIERELRKIAARVIALGAQDVAEQVASLARTLSPSLRESDSGVASGVDRLIELASKR